MAELKFVEDGHLYFIDSRPVPSVTDICSILTAENRAKLNPHLLDAAARRGTLVHECTELLDYGVPPEDMDMPADIVPYVTAYQRFLRDYKPRWIAVEKQVYDAEIGLAGTLDRQGVVDDYPCILDIKTTTAPTREQKISWCAQLAGYRLLHRNATLERYILQLRPDGSYKLYNCRDLEQRYSFDGQRLFRQCLEIHRILRGD